MGSDGFSEDSKRASEVSFVYDKVRQAELQRSIWKFATKRVCLRPVDTTTMLLSPSLWGSTTTYYGGSIVADQNGGLWKSTIPNNVGNDPLLTTFWEPYFGPMSVSSYDATTSYLAGEIVYTYAGDGTYRVYISLQDNNSANPSTATAWDATVTYFKDQVVTYSSVAYKSLFDLNLNQTPNTSPLAWTSTFTGGSGAVTWLEIGGVDFPAGVALATLTIIYPIGTGPSSQLSSRNVFLLPAGFLRPAPQNPKPGMNPLGGPSGYDFDDWNFESGYLISAQVGPVMLRFVADVTDVRRMSTMFCEGLAARIGIEVAQPITQSDARLGTIAKMYEKFMSEARLIDEIEDGYIDEPDDELITVRL